MCKNNFLNFLKKDSKIWWPIFCFWTLKFDGPFWYIYKKDSLVTAFFIIGAQYSFVFRESQSWDPHKNGSHRKFWTVHLTKMKMRIITLGRFSHVLYPVYSLIAVIIEPWIEFYFRSPWCTKQIWIFFKKIKYIFK